MKAVIFNIVVIAFFLFTSCAQEQPYHLYWQDNYICVVMPHPTMGVVQLGKENWRGVELDRVVNDIYNELVNTSNTGNITIWVRFENPQTDKYGNKTMTYDDYEIATIPKSEAMKYQSSTYLDSTYEISKNIRQAAFGNFE